MPRLLGACGQAQCLALFVLDDEALEALAYSGEVAKCGVRDLPAVIARGEDGATTVAATSHLADRARG